MPCLTEEDFPDRKNLSADSPLDPQREVYVALSGGGAKAMVHTGALTEIEKRYRIVGISGTSAGAIVAALIAAGYKPSELFTTSPEGNGISAIFDRLREKRPDINRVSDLFGSKNFGKIKASQNPLFGLLYLCVLNKWKFIALVAFLSVAVETAMSFSQDAEISIQGSVNTLWNLLLGLVSLVVVLVSVAIFVAHAAASSLRHGLLNNEMAIDAICDLISERLKKPRQLLKMSDFPMLLKIVATDVVNQKAVVFSSEGTNANANLRDALIASTAIPVVFRPHRRDGNILVDGGIVSNLPASTFAEEAYLYPARRIVAVSFQSASEGEDGSQSKTFRAKIVQFLTEAILPSRWIYQRLRPVFATFFTGTQALSYSRLDVLDVPLKTPLDTLDFDVGMKTLVLAYDAGLAAATTIDAELTIDRAYRDGCRALVSTAGRLLCAETSTSSVASEAVRVSVATMSSDSSKTLTLRYCFGFDEAPDQFISMPIAHSVCGDAWLSKEVKFSPNLLEFRNHAPQFDHIFGRIDKEIKWILSIPIMKHERNEVLFVFNVDGKRYAPEGVVASNGLDLSTENAIFNIAREARRIGDGIAKTVKSVSEMRRGTKNG